MSAQVAEGAETRIGTGDTPQSLPVYGALLASACMFVGWQWDISWHRSIGRDTLWTPPHLAIYAALAIAFAYNAYLVLSHTFGTRRGLPSVRVLGFRGPGPAFVTLWGILAQYTSIVFDAWWHEAYGLDSAVFTPPHFVLGTAIAAFYFGQGILVAVYGNTFLRDRVHFVRWSLLFLWAMALANSLVGADALYGPYAIRAPAFLLSGSFIILFVLAMVREYTRWKWAMVALAGLYMACVVVLMQLFQSFPAEPRFGPVFSPIDRFAPPPFPVLVIVPALAVTWIWERSREWPRALTHLVISGAFTLVFVAVNFASSAFLLTEWSHNRLFAGDYPAAAFQKGYRPVAQLGWDGASLATGIVAVVAGAVALWLGGAFGRWLRTAVR